MKMKKTLQKGKLVRNNYWGYLFIAPPIIGFLVFQMVPIVFSLIVSFTKYDFWTPMTFTGFENIQAVFSDEIFWSALKNTLIAVIGVPFQIVFALLVAVLLSSKRIKGQSVLRTLVFIPGLCSSVAIALVWKWVYNTDYGILNSIITAFGGAPVKWLADKNIVMVSMIIQGVWMGIGGGMVMYIAALKGVPAQLYEAAEIDGIKAIPVFLKITVPLISPTTLYLLITSIMSNMQDFARYNLMTDGGPGYASTTLTLYIYQVVFKYSDLGFGFGTTMGWILAVIVVAFVGIVFGTSKRWVHYND